MDLTYIKYAPDQWVEVSGRIRNTYGDPIWRPGQLRAWTRTPSDGFGHVHYFPDAQREFMVIIPADRIKGAWPPE